MDERFPPVSQLQPDLQTVLAWPLLSMLASGFDSTGGRSTKGLSDKLLQQIHHLSVTAYEQLVAELLRVTGYDQVQVLRDSLLCNSQRKRRSHKGRNSHGGIDLIAETRSGLSSDAVLVQVKQYERTVSRRFVDELRGALLRTESRHALLITTSYFSPAARKAAQEDHIAPVHLIDGNRLCSLLIQHEIGARRDRRGGVQVDRDFFEHLEALHGAAETSNPATEPPHHDIPVAINNRHLKQRRSAASAGDVLKKGGDMMGRTHALIGIAALWLLEVSGAVSPGTMVSLIPFAVIGALTPDLDASESKLKRFAVAGIAPLAPLAQALHQWLGHRGLLHSIAGLSIFTVLCALPVACWLGWIYGAALSLGYASHILADSMTKSGVPLLHPRRQRYHLLPKGWRLTTGSLAEEMLLPLLAFAIFLTRRSRNQRGSISLVEIER